MNRILGNIYLSSITPLQDHSITTTTIQDILSIIPGDLPSVVAQYHHLQIPVNDDLHTIIYPYLPEIFNFINQSLFDHNHEPNTKPSINIKTPHKRHLLIHCHEGLSRSVTVLIFYLIKYYHLSLNQAIYAIKRKQEININDFFMQQLVLYEKVGGDLSDLAIRDFLIQHKGVDGYKMFNTMNASVHDKPVPSEVDPSPPQSSDNIPENPPSHPDKPGIITCKKCRHPLCTSQQLLPHTPPDDSSTQGNFIKKLRRTVYQSTKASSFCSHYFLQDPLKWMKLNEDQELECKLHCPNCEWKVGGYSWKGSRCSCGKWVIPSFNLLVSKIDFKYTKSSPEVVTDQPAHN